MITSLHHFLFALEFCAEHCEHLKYGPRVRVFLWKSTTHGANVGKGVSNHKFRNCLIEALPQLQGTELHLWKAEWLLSPLPGVYLSHTSEMHHKTCDQAALGVSTRTVTIQSQTSWCSSDEISTKRKVHLWKARKKKEKVRGPRLQQGSVKLRSCMTRQRSTSQQLIEPRHSSLCFLSGGVPGPASKFAPEAT